MTYSDFHLARIIQALLVITLVSYANTVWADAPELPEDAYFTRTSATEVPDHVAFVDLLENLYRTEAEAGRQYNLDHIRTHLALNERRAGIFLDHALSSYAEIVRSNRDVTQQMLCRDSLAKQQAYNVMDVLDDLKEATARQHYKNTIIAFGADFSSQLDFWLAEIKEGTSHHKYDHRRVFELTNESVRKVIGDTCQYIAAAN